MCVQSEKVPNRKAEHWEKRPGFAEKPRPVPLRIHAFRSSTRAKAETGSSLFRELLLSMKHNNSDWEDGDRKRSLIEKARPAIDLRRRFDDLRLLRLARNRMRTTKPSLDLSHELDLTAD
jgi:hypothetical protein